MGKSMIITMVDVLQTTWMTVLYIYIVICFKDVYSILYYQNIINRCSH